MDLSGDIELIGECSEMSTHLNINYKVSAFVHDFDNLLSVFDNFDNN